jgi:hypothetical protein
MLPRRSPRVFADPGKILSLGALVNEIADPFRHWTALKSRHPQVDDPCPPPPVARSSSVVQGFDNRLRTSL